MLEEWKEFYMRVKYRGREPEEIINIQIVKWLRENYPGLLFWHTPSEGKRHPLTQLRNKLLGVVSGVPDIFIPLPQKVKFMVTAAQIKGFEDMWKKIGGNTFQPLLLNQVPNHPDPQFKRGYTGFFCELKAGKNKPTKTQNEMMQKLTELGYYCCVCYTLDEFIKEWTDYVS